MGDHPRSPGVGRIGGDMRRWRPGDRDPADRRVHVRGGSIGRERQAPTRRREAGRFGSRSQTSRATSIWIRKSLLGRGVGIVPVLPASNALLLQRQADGGGRWGTASGPRGRTSGRFRRRLDVDVPPEARAPLRATVRGHADRRSGCRSSVGANRARHVGGGEIGYPFYYSAIRVRRIRRRTGRFDRWARDAR